MKIESCSCRLQLSWDSDLLYQNSATTIQSFLDELIGGREMFQQVFILDVVNFHDMVLERRKELLI